MTPKKPKIWFDFSNPPHVNLFLPLLKHFEKKGIKTHSTARDFVETKGLLNKYQIQFQLFGRHGGKNRFAKIYNLLKRNYKLYQHLPSFDFNISSSGSILGVNLQQPVGDNFTGQPRIDVLGNGSSAEVSSLVDQSVGSY